MTPRNRFRLQALGLVAFLGGCLFVFLFLLHAAGVRSPTADARTLEVVLPEATNLARKADVRMGGVRVGQVDRVEQMGDRAVAELRLDDGLGPIYDNARVQLRYKSALNEGFVDLIRGGGAATRELPDGGTLPLSAAQESVKVDDVLSTFDPRTRRGLQAALDGLGPGLEGRGDDLNDLIAALSETVDRGAPLFATLAGERDDTGRLIDHFGQVADALGARETALRVLATRSRDIARVVAARDGQVRQLIAELPGTLDQARQSADRLGTLSTTATPVLADLRGAMQELAPAVRNLQPAAAASRGAVRQLRGFIPKADPLFARLRPFASAASGLLGPLDGVLRQLNPLTSYLSSQRRNIATFFATYTSATDTVDATGHLNSLSFLFNREAVRSVVPPAGQEALDALEEAGLLSFIGGKVQQNPYPADGDIANPQPFSGDYPRLRAQPRRLRDAP